MNLKEQLYVCTLADTGSLTLAARQLFISQPALSLYISNLETTLGVRLFDRVGKRFVPTYAGELYLSKARPMLALKDDFDASLREMMLGQNERLRIGIQDIRYYAIVPDVLPDLTEKYPKTKFIWQNGYYKPLEYMLRNNELDLFFCNCRPQYGEFEYLPISTDELVFLTARNHPLVRHARLDSSGKLPAIDLKLFENERFLLTTPKQSLRAYSDQALKASGVSPREIYDIQKIFSIIRLVSKDFGVGFCQLGYTRLCADFPNFHIFSFLNPPITSTFYAVYKKGHFLTEAEHYLIDSVTSIMNAQIQDIYKAAYYGL